MGNSVKINIARGTTDPRHIESLNLINFFKPFKFEFDSHHLGQASARICLVQGEKYTHMYYVITFKSKDFKYKL